jgi:glutamate dehydrogenase (NADP+)
MLERIGETFKDKVVAVSGFGNVSWGAIKKLLELGAKIITISGPDGYVLDEKGFDEEKCEFLLDMRASCNDQAEDYVERYPEAKFFKGEKPWGVKCDIALLCATQNECDEADVNKLLANGCKMILEVSNMGCTAEAAKIASEKMLFAPGKAVNAGGVAVSGLEMTQNSERLNWTENEVDARLKQIMHSIHAACVEHGKEGDRVNYIKGANIAGFMKVANAMMDQGIV